jgi:hypothetical protein
MSAIMRRVGATQDCSDLNGPHQRLVSGATSLGWSWRTATRNVDRDRYDPAYSGYIHYGDLSGAKTGTLKTFLRDAYEHGARILTRTRADAILTEAGRATGVRATYTDPETGMFSVELPRSADYVTRIDSAYQGYDPQTTTVTVGEADVTVDAALTADLEVCAAPGYDWNGLSTGFTDWDAQATQQGWQVDAKGPGTWRFDNPQMRMQPPMANGSFAIADPATQGRKISTTLTSPAIDLSGQDSPSLTLDMRYLGAAKNAAATSHSGPIHGRRHQTRLGCCRTASGRDGLSVVVIGVLVFQNYV